MDANSQLATTHVVQPIISVVWNAARVIFHNQLQGLHSSGRLTTAQYEQFNDFLHTVFPIMEAHPGNDNVYRCWALSDALLPAGRLLVLFSQEDIDENSRTTMLSNLFRSVKPTSPQLVEKQLARLSHQPQNVESSATELASLVVFPYPKQSLGPLRDGLAFLIGYLTSAPAEDLEPLSSAIKKGISDAASFDYSSSSLSIVGRHLISSPDHLAKGTEEPLGSATKKEICDAVSSLDNSSSSSTEAPDDKDGDKLELFRLQLRIEILRVEVVLNKLSQGDSIPEGSFESIEKGSRFLQTFLKCPLDAESEKLILICERLEEVAKEAAYLPIEPGRLRDALQSKLRINFLLTKIQAFLMELMRCGPSLMAPINDQVEELHQALELYYKYSSVPSDDDDHDDDAQMMFSYIERAANPQATQPTIQNLSLLLTDLLEIINRFNAKNKGKYLQLRSSLELALPKTHQGMAFPHSFLEKLNRMIQNKADSIGHSLKHQIAAVQEELVALTSLLGEVPRKQNGNPKLKDLCRSTTWAAYQVDYILDSILLLNGGSYLRLWLSDVIDEMKASKAELIEILEMKNDSAEVDINVQISGGMITPTDTSDEVAEVVISLEDQETIIVNRLTRGSRRLEVVTIVGMAGIGKTTLANKVYNNPTVKTVFHKQAWCCVSQVFRKRELLLKILSDIVETTDEILHGHKDEDLLEMLCRLLKGKRYLIVMDDVWSAEVWQELKIAFPDHQNGSRIMFTSRYEKVPFEAQHDCAHPLRFLTEDESCNLLHEKVFRGDGCPEELKEVAWGIARSCKGLPLSIVAIAGVLRRLERKAECWEQIEQDINSHILEDPENRCMQILELSYNHLPDDLKPCFLYFASFGEDDEVPVQKLARLLIAEGFIRRDDSKASLEDIAAGYLKDLIGRRLLMAARRGSNGEIKACKIHDLLLKLCSTKAEEENFLQSITGYEKLFPSNSRLDYGVDLEYPLSSISYKQHRISIRSKRNHFAMLKPSGPPVRSLLFSGTSDRHPRCPYDLSFIPRNFKLLRVLDMENINMGFSFPEGFELIDPLRYLAVSGDISSIPATITKLWLLETFIVKGLRGKVALPDTIWSMSSLRHLHVNPSAAFSLPKESSRNSSPLDNLVTLSSPTFSDGEDTVEILKKFPRLQKLRCIFSEPAQHSENSICFLLKDLLLELESLDIFYHGSTRFPCELSFPLNLKKLALRDFSLTWDCISTIGALPKLQVLKLVSIAFEGPTWEMKDDEFQQLEYLKLDSLKIVEWIVESDHLPRLQRLALQNCKHLQEVPSSFGEIPTLQMIELTWCSRFLEDSVRAIKELQVEYGNKEFKVNINVSAANFRSSF